MQLALLIGLGGFLGTIARYYTGHLIYKFVQVQFPLATLIVNLSGCFIIGIIYGWFEKQHVVSSDWKLILTAGFCGGFTTFSAFTSENIQLLRDGQIGPAILYIVISVVAGLLLSYGGMQLIRAVA